MREKILKWFATGKVGASSRCMASVAAGMIGSGDDYPLDPSDLNRCLLMLEAVPEVRAYLYVIATISPIWSRFVDRWDELESCFLDEAGRDWSKAQTAPKTYAMMREIRGVK